MRQTFGKPKKKEERKIKPGQAGYRPSAPTAEDRVNSRNVTFSDIVDATGGATAAQDRLAEVSSYGITPDLGTALSDNKLSEARNTALRVNQREQLRKQNQELQELTLSGRKRKRGRGSLLAYMGKQGGGTLGPSGALQ